MSAVICNKLTKTFGKQKALDEVNFSIEENTITGLIGRNGAGKTTLLKIMAGRIRQTEGELEVLSQKPFNNLFVSENSVFIDDNMVFPNTLTLTDILELGAEFYQNWNDKLARSLLDYFSLPHSRPHYKLSKGMKSTFNVIFGLAATVSLTIFDEPTTGMDAAVRKDFYRVLLKEYLNKPRTMILSSHLLNELESLLEHILLLHNGKVVLNRPLEELKEHALAVKGHKKTIDSLMEPSLILHEEPFGENGVLYAVENKLPGHKLSQLKEANVSISPLGVDDLCIYLTDRNKGGIDAWL